MPLEIWNRHPERRISVFPINRPVSSISASIGTFHPCDRRDTRSGYFPDRTRHRPRTQEEYDRHPTGFCDSPTSIPNTSAWFSDWPREHASIGGRLPPNLYGTMRSGRDHPQTPAREDSRSPSATAIHAHTSRCKMCVAALELPACTSGTAARPPPCGKFLRGPHGCPASFSAYSSQSSLQAERLPRADSQSLVPD